jgi:type II secretory pathway pseudopilin PulG
MMKFAARSIRASRKSTVWNARKSSRSSARGLAGVTLIELLVVLGVIALVVAIALPSLAGARDSSRRTRCLANLRGLSVSTVAYAQNYSSFPLTEALSNRFEGRMTMPMLLDGVEVDAPIPGHHRCPSDIESSPDWASYVFAPARLMRSFSDDDFYLPSTPDEGLETPPTLWRQYESGVITAPIWLDRTRVHMPSAQRTNYEFVPDGKGTNGSFVDGSARILD